MSRVGDLIVEICELYEDGYSMSEIARKLKIPISWVRRTIKEYYHELIEES